MRRGSATVDVEARVHAMVRASGGRLTAPTRAIVSILASTEDHLTADDLIAEVERRVPGVAASTIYRVIQRLGEIDVIEHVHSGNGPAFYHLGAHGHAHLVCNSCGAVIDIPDGLVGSLASTVRDRFGFTLDPHHSALLGLCAKCSQPSRRTST